MRYFTGSILIICFLLSPLSAMASENKLSGCMCKSENGYIPNAFILSNENVWIVSRCSRAEEKNWCISSRHSFSKKSKEIVFETRSDFGEKDTWKINLETGRTTQRIDDQYGKAIGGELCDCKFSDDMDGFIDGLITGKF